MDSTGIKFLAVSALLLFLLFGLTAIDTDIAMQKKLEVKSLLELANHHATFAINHVLKTEGIIDLNYEEAIQLFAQRMQENGDYQRGDKGFHPSSSSVTTDFLPTFFYYVDFLGWTRDTQLELNYSQQELQLIGTEIGTSTKPSGGTVWITITTDSGEQLQLPPKKMIGPSLIVVSYVDERPLAPLLPAHSFPVVSIEELKW